MISNGNKIKSCLILYSGGTDSTCAAALLAEEFLEIHLLSFYQGGEKRAIVVNDNIDALKNRFTKNQFVHKVVATTKLVKFISYDQYIRYFIKYRWLVLSTCGFTTLSWHINAIVYCLENDISVVADGLTKELMHFPGHMDEVIGVFRGLYEEFGIQYINPVRNWEVPPDRQFIDKLIVDQHGYFFPSESSQANQRRTTGQYLYGLGILANPDVKGSPLDQKMQYDCYPFVLYNIMVFWIYLSFRPYEYLCARMKVFFEEKTNDMRILLKEYLILKEKSRLHQLLGKGKD